ncbi:MAG: transporter [Phycisphaerales bacterium]|nr:transporter [Phycisphaerales bacterium]MCB9864842.1 transporter [Phycisphaerales bacterium]
MYAVVANILVMFCVPDPASAPAGADAASRLERCAMSGKPTVEPMPGPLALTDDRQEPASPLVTDRPDFTESTLTVPSGHLQIESGFTFASNRRKGVRTRRHTFPEILLRAGLAHDVELRIAWAGWTRTTELLRAENDVGRNESMTDSSTGGNDLSLGAKFHLADQSGWRPDVGLIVAASLPTGHIAHSSGDVDPFVGLLWSYDIGESFAIAGNLNLAMPTIDGDRIVEPQSSVSLSYSISDNVGAFVEYFGFYPTAGDGPDAHYVDGGFTFLLSDDFQIDVRAGAGLNDDADDVFAGVGFAWRF